MKKIFVVMMLCMIFCSGTVLANEYEAEEGELVQEDELSVEPKFSYLNHVTTGLRIENERVIYTASARAAHYDVRLNLYLQRSKNELIWDNIRGSIKTEYDNNLLEVTHKVSPDDYFYRAKVVVEVLDANKNVIETVTAYSDSERY